MIINRKKIVSPPQGNPTLKELFKHAVVAGAGRPVDKDGFVDGSWTPALLVNAIAQTDRSGNGVDLRTVQLWFQDDDRGVSPNGIRCLAHVFGCGDPDKTHEWQVALSMARSRSIAKRRQERGKTSTTNLNVRSSTNERMPDSSTEFPHVDPVSNASQTGLAARTKDLFSRYSIISVPTLVFAGAVGVCFLSIILGFHSLEFSQADGTAKQVGVLWAPNWTLLIWVLLPAYLYTAVSLLRFWENELRAIIVSKYNDRKNYSIQFNENIIEMELIFWAILILSVIISVAPILAIYLNINTVGSDISRNLLSWHKMAIAQPNVVPVSTALLFTAVAHFYLGFCVYLYFASLVIIKLVIFNFNQLEICDEVPIIYNFIKCRNIIFNNVSKITIIGIFISISIKLQKTYLMSDSNNILTMLLSEIRYQYSNYEDLGSIVSNHFNSLIISLITISVFINSCFSLRKISGVIIDPEAAELLKKADKNFATSQYKMIAIVVILTIIYLSIGVFRGFSIFLIIASVCAIFGLLRNNYGRSGGSAHVL